MYQLLSIKCKTKIFVIHLKKYRILLFHDALCTSPTIISKLKPVFLPDHSTLNGDLHKCCIYLEYILYWSLINNVFPSFTHPYYECISLLKPIFFLSIFHFFILLYIEIFQLTDLLLLYPPFWLDYGVVISFLLPRPTFNAFFLPTYIFY